MKILNNYEQKIIDLQNKVINLALVSFSFMAIWGQLLAIIRAVTYGITLAFIIQSIDVVLLFVLTLFRNRLSIKQKVFYVLLIILCVLITGLYSFGFYASSKYYIPIIPVFISFIVSYRYSIISLIILLTCFVVFGVLYHYGILEYHFDLHNYLSNPIVWLLDITIILFTSFGLLNTGYYFRKTIIENKTTNQELLLELIVLSFICLFVIAS